MIRGTTPTMHFELPFEATDIDEGYITISQRGLPNLDIPISRCTTDGNVLTLSLTQEETLRFRPAPAELQLRVKTDENVLASEIITFDIGAILKEGVI